MGGFGPSTSRRGISEGPELSVSRPDGFSDGQRKGRRRFAPSSRAGQTSNPPHAAFVGANHLFAGLALHQIRPRARSAAAPRQRVSYSRSLNPGPTSVPVCDAGPIFTLESERSLTIAQAGMLEPTPGVDRNTARRAGAASPRSPRRKEEGLMTTTKIQSTHCDRIAFVYVRQSTPLQVIENRESTERQDHLRELAIELGWPSVRVEVIN